MAIVWSGKMGERSVEVRSAGATRRVYVDGVLHTAWNPRTGVTGAVWDPLALGAYATSRPVRAALLLGVGGGAAIHLLRRHVGPARITAVEIEPEMVEVARREFGVDGPDLDLVVGDAVAWVRARPRGRFDLVVDDIFGEAGGEPVRAAGGVSWWRRLAGLTAARGVLVVNFPEPAALWRSAVFRDPWFRRRFPSAVRFVCPGYTNAIVALSGDADPDPAAALRARLRAVASLRVPAARRALRARARTLWEPSGDCGHTSRRAKTSARPPRRHPR